MALHRGRRKSSNRGFILRQRVGCDVKAGQLSLVFECLRLIPLRQIGQRRIHERSVPGIRLISMTEDAGLPALSFSLDGSTFLDGLLQHCHQRRTAGAGGVERADLNQPLEYPFVDLPEINAVTEVQERAEGAGALSRLENGLDRSLTDVFDRSQAKPNRALHDRKVLVALVDIRREDADT